MEQKFELTTKTNKVVPIIIAVLGALYGLSPVDAIPDFIPVAGWADDLVVVGGSLLGLAQAFVADTNAFFAKFLGLVKWALWLLGGITILLFSLLGVTIYSLFT